LKSSKPETSEDSSNKAKQSKNSEKENDQLILINKDSFDEDCNNLIFIINKNKTIF